MYAGEDDTKNRVLVNTTAERSSDICNMKENKNEIKPDSSEDNYASPFLIDKKPICNNMTVTELYEEILFVILSNISETNLNINSEALIEYAREVFGIAKEKHSALLKNVQTKKSPQKIICIEVDRAENLSPMDSNGLSDPFVTIYIQSNAISRHNTAVVPSTLNPSWKEHFYIPIQRTTLTELLVVEVWDFDAAESVSEKVNKLVGVKGIRGFKKLLKEIALTASTGKHDNELIGRIDIPLKSIPATGVKSWYTLKKGSSHRNRGSILLDIHFSTEKKKVIAFKEHQSILRIFLLHELKFKNFAPYTWCGKFNSDANTIIKWHSTQSNLTEIDCAICQWNVYTKVHETICLSLKLFNLLLNKLMPEMQVITKNDQSICQFWEGYKRILPSCFMIVRSIRSEKFKKLYGIEGLSAALEIIGKAEPSAIPENVNLFSPCIYGWIYGANTKDHIKLTPDIVLKETIKLSALQFLSKVYENGRTTSENALQHLVLVMRSIIHDLQEAVEIYDNHFCLKSNVKYAALLYNMYEENVAALFFQKISQSCNHLNQLNVLDEEIMMASHLSDFKSGTLLFDLYLGFKRFTSLGLALCLPPDKLVNNKFYEYFYPAVANWLNISVIKTLTRIERAIELDEFLPYNNVMKYTSSALDTLSLFYQIKYFWEQLEWPNVEESYLFVEKIVHDVCRCCLFYANRISKRLDELKQKNCTDGLKEVCYAINDINYIKESLPHFVKELLIDEILKKLAEYRSSMEAKRCSDTINNLISNTVDIVENKMFELIEVVSQTVIPIIQTIFEEASETQYENSDRMDHLLKQFQKSINFFQTELQENNLSKLTSIVCNELSLIMYELMRSVGNKYQEPLIFQNIQRILNTMLQILNFSIHTTTCADNLKNICTILRLHSMDTDDIIHQYYEDQLRNQKVNSQNRYGQLSIKANLLSDSLQIHILNAYQLLPINSENACNSYVKVHFTPQERFIGIQSLRTSVQHKTRCPLYDEQFSIKLTPKLRQNKNSVLIFCVKNKDLFGIFNHYIAECYITFADIEKSNNRQIRINLSKPKYLDTDIIHILESRNGDKRAKEFLRKLRQKSLK